MTKLLLLLAAVGCSFLHPKHELEIKRLPEALAQTNACFLLYDLRSGKFAEVINEERCKKPEAPCSTFKIPLAVMGFDQGIFNTPGSRPYKWDGKKRLLDVWNKEQTVKTWMENSVVWFSQNLTRELGRKKVQEYLEKFSYGNEDFSRGVEDAWLTATPFSKEMPKTSVRITAYEQIDFMKGLYTFSLPVSMNAMTMTQSILTSEASSSGSVLTGKTGSGFVGESSKRRLGWYVAHLNTGTEEYLAVLTFDDQEPQKKDGLGGMVARESMKQLLAEKGLW